MGLSFYVDPAVLIKLSGAARFFLAILRRRARSSGFGTLLCGSLRNYCGAQPSNSALSNLEFGVASFSRVLVQPYSNRQFAASRQRTLTLDHFAALFVELAYFFGGFMIDEEMRCANGVSAYFDLIEWRANESALATHIFETIFEPTWPNSLSRDEPTHGLLRQDHRCDERAKAMGEDEHASGIHESVALQGA